MKKLQSGRSMIEMLGVLAIIGVLSIGGLAAYNTAMSRNKANDILAYAAQCAVIAETDYHGKTLPTTGMPCPADLGSDFSGKVMTKKTDTAGTAVTITGADSTACGIAATKTTGDKNVVITCGS